MTQFELEQVTAFLLHHMSMETRLKMMAEMPVAYAKLTGADPAVILAAVDRQLTAK
jgi:hypothetical protein